MHFEIKKTSVIARKLEALKALFEGSFPCVNIGAKFYISIAKEDVETKQCFTINQGYKLVVDLIRNDKNKAVLVLRTRAVEYHGTVKQLGVKRGYSALAARFVRT